MAGRSVFGIPAQLAVPQFFQFGAIAMNIWSVGYFDLTNPDEVEVVLNLAEVDSRQGYIRQIRLSIRDTPEGQEATQLRRLIPLLVRGSEEGVLEEIHDLREHLAESQVARQDLEQQFRELREHLAESQVTRQDLEQQLRELRERMGDMLKMFETLVNIEPPS